MSDIFSQHDNMFREISAYVILQDGDMVGRVAFRHRTRCTCFLHIFGASMSKGIADGGGYDKASAAATSAAAKQVGSLTGDGAVHVQRIRDAFAKARDGEDWRRTIDGAGYTVLQAI